MKVLVPRLDLVTLIGRVQSIVSTKPAIPILANILLEARDDQLIISATDLTVSMRAYVEAKVAKEGGIVLPARQFFQLIRELITPTVEIHVTSSGIASINAGSSHFKLHGMHPQEFPTLPDLSNESSVTLSPALLKEMFARTLFSAARDTTKPILQSVCLQLGDETLTFLSTDGKRMSKIHFRASEVQLPSGSYVIPLKAVEEIVRLLDEKEDSLKLVLMQDRMAIEVGVTTLITKLLSGQYPDIIRIIPEKKAEPLVLHREELISLLRQVALFAPEKSCSVKFTFADGSLHLSATHGELGEGTVNMPVNYSGEKLDIAFNPHFFLDILRHSKDETVHFRIADSYNPGLVTDSSTAEFVIMPMRLDVPK